MLISQRVWLGGSINGDNPIAGWFIMENPIDMNDLGVALWLGKPPIGSVTGKKPMSNHSTNPAAYLSIQKWFENRRRNHAWPSYRDFTKIYIKNQGVSGKKKMLRAIWGLEIIEFFNQKWGHTPQHALKVRRNWWIIASLTLSCG